MVHRLTVDWKNAPAGHPFKEKVESVIRTALVTCPESERQLQRWNKENGGPILSPYSPDLCGLRLSDYFDVLPSEVKVAEFTLKFEKVEP